MNQDTLDLIKQLAAKFGVTIDYLWPLMVQYTRWANIAIFTIDILILIGAAIVLVKAIPFFFKHFLLYNNRKDDAYVDYALHAGYSIIATIVSVVAVICSEYNCHGSIQISNRYVEIYA